jgi:5-(carboxyamino)imidazole ribonucleotide synthase
VSNDPILPGARIGVLGSGQLGRMFAIAARRMGYRVHVFSNVPYATAEAAAEFVPVRPAGRVLHTTQQRGREKHFLATQGIPAAPHALVDSSDETLHALERIGLPAVLKSAGFGYDGKGQRVLRERGDVDLAWRSIGADACLLEAFVDFELECSVIAARGVDGAQVDFGVVENRHVDAVLDVSIAPARVEPRIAQRAREIARGVLEALDVVGVLCVEFFLTRQGELWINEVAPRPHNSGHWSVDAALTCQFEQQLRAVCGLPLGDPSALRPAAMANLLGDRWRHGEPDWHAAVSDPRVKLHVYGKSEPKPGRKMGHLTALAESPDAALAAALEARRRLDRNDTQGDTTTTN